MGAIKDVVDLTEKLLNRVKNREFANDVKNILSLISAVQRDQIETEDRNSKLAEENAQLKRRIAELEKVDKSSLTWGRDGNEPKFELTDDMVEVLKLFTGVDSVDADSVAASCSHSREKAQYLIDQLFKGQLINFPLIFGESRSYFLTDQGREYLFEKGLLD